MKLFGETIVEVDPESLEGTIQLHFGRMLPFLLELSKFVRRTYVLVKNVIFQLSSLYSNPQPIYATFKTIHLQTLFDHLSDLFIMLISLDEIIFSNESFSEHLVLYKRLFPPFSSSWFCRMVKAMQSDPKRYNVEEEKLWQIEKMLYSLKAELLDGRIFQVSEDPIHCSLFFVISV